MCEHMCRRAGSTLARSHPGLVNGVQAMSQTEVAASPATLARDDSWVWFNGDFARYRDAKIGLMTHALHYGTGCFEGIRAYWNPNQEQLFALLVKPHFARLRQSAKILQIEMPYTNDELIRWTAEILRRNDARTDTY